MWFKKVSDFLKINYPNFYIICISGLITLWFNYFTQIASHYLPKKNINTKWIIFVCITLLLYLGDESLNELYSFDHPAALKQQIPEGDDNIQSRRIAKNSTAPNKKKLFKKF